MMRSKDRRMEDSEMCLTCDFDKLRRGGSVLTIHPNPLPLFKYKTLLLDLLVRRFWWGCWNLASYPCPSGRFLGYGPSAARAWGQTQGANIGSLNLSLKSPPFK